MTRSIVDLGLSRLRYRVQSWLRNRKARAELYGYADSELGPILRDVGLTRHDLEALTSCRHAGPSNLMPRRLERLGLDPAYVRLFHTSTYRDLERVCASCKAWRRCARDLARQDVQSGMGSYCLNAATIDALRFGRPPWDPSYS